MTSIIKVDTIQDSSGNNIINESSNTITVGASGDTTNIIGTLQKDGVAVVNSPAFRTKFSGAQTPSSATVTTANFDTVDFEIGGSNYDTTNKYFVVPSAGKYFFYANIYGYNTSNDLDRIIVYLNQNGSTTIQNDMQILNSPGHGNFISAVLDCSANDQIQIQFYAVFSGTFNMESSRRNYFGGFKLIT